MAIRSDEKPIDYAAHSLCSHARFRRGPDAVGWPDSIGAWELQLYAPLNGEDLGHSSVLVLVRPDVYLSSAARVLQLVVVPSIPVAEEVFSFIAASLLKRGAVFQSNRTWTPSSRFAIEEDTDVFSLVEWRAYVNGESPPEAEEAEQNSAGQLSAERMLSVLGD